MPFNVVTARSYAFDTIASSKVATLPSAGAGGNDSTPSSLSESLSDTSSELCSESSPFGLSLSLSLFFFFFNFFLSFQQQD